MAELFELLLTLNYFRNLLLFCDIAMNKNFPVVFHNKIQINLMRQRNEANWKPCGNHNSSASAIYIIFWIIHTAKTLEYLHLHFLCIVALLIIILYSNSVT